MTGKDKTKLRTIVSALAGVLCLLSFTSSCAPKRLAEWTPRRPVQWARVSVPSVEPVWDGYRILIAQPTRGLFPASMSVTRVGLEMTDHNVLTERAQLFADPRNEFLQWNRAFDNLMAVSEVFPIAERDLGGGPSDPTQILAASAALHTRLTLVYAVNELSRTETEMFGVLYATKASRPLASLHARAFSVPPPEGKAGTKAEVDLWLTDSRALVRERFERSLHTCIRELILHDERDSVSAPSGWTPAGPIRPVEWPPRRFRTGG